MTQAMQGPSLMTSTSSSSLLSQDAFKAGVKVLMSEYNWKPDESQLRQWYRTLGWLTDDVWMNAIDNWLLSNSEWRPKPGQLLQMARQMTPREEYERKQRQEAQQAERKAQPSSVGTLQRDWPRIMEQEKAMSFTVRRAILAHLRLGYKKPEDIKIVLDTIDLMTIEKAMVLAYDDPVAEAVTIATKLYNKRKEVSE
tara:strand:- start:684 stop:1274 length:591 start_codon:yes stop_codon:yes gene_type:complete